MVLFRRNRKNRDVLPVGMLKGRGWGRVTLDVDVLGINLCVGSSATWLRALVYQSWRDRLDWQVYGRIHLFNCSFEKTETNKNRTISCITQQHKE